MSLPPSSNNPYKPGSSPYKPGAAPASGSASRSQGDEILAELVQSQRHISQLNQELTDMRTKLGRRTHQMAVLQHVAEILAATPKVAQVASVLQDVFIQEFNAHTCVVWILEDAGGGYQPRAGYGLPRSVWNQLRLPAPNPFPDAPIVLFQHQWLDSAPLTGQLEALRSGPDASLFFVPFEHQLLLMGFAVMSLDTGRHLEEDLETLTVLQRQVAVSIYNAWLFRDLGEQRDTLKRQAAELEKANVALREADRFKSEFLALTSHELRTPLTGILGFTRLVMDGLYDDEDEMRRMLGDSYASGKHLLDLLNDILDLAKIEAGRMQIHLDPCSLQSIVEEIKPIAEAYPRKPEVALIWPEELESMPDVLVDAGRLRQILLNVLSNALKFTREGSVRLVVERGIGQISLQVVDTGIGVTPEAQARLFQKFVQAEGGHSREYGGTGLGLVICKNLIEMMGGTISLFSEGAGLGTTMTVTVQIA
ncbi:MAG TPA: HAMP domain-containing sensor histidine kinase [Holophaga sp.]|jgi:signal transduction histidine kinase|nr:HAMP domain-containing sensor histidine kinase [Holophaga sp.]